MMYSFTRFLLTVTMRVFFRDLTGFNSERVPEEGPVIFVVGPHNNYFVDPILLLITCSRKMGFVVAKPTMDKPIIGAGARALGGITVTRPQDLREDIQGTITHEVPNKVYGQGTQFLKHFKPGESIYAKEWKRWAVVEKVISDTEMELRGDGFAATEYPPQPGESPFVFSDSLMEAEDDIILDLTKPTISDMDQDGGNRNTISSEQGYRTTKNINGQRNPQQVQVRKSAFWFDNNSSPTNVQRKSSKTFTNTIHPNPTAVQLINSNPEQHQSTTVQETSSEASEIELDESVPKSPASPTSTGANHAVIDMTSHHENQQNNTNANVLARGGKFKSIKFKKRPIVEIDFSKPTEFKRTPKIDQSMVYQKVWDELAQNKCIGIFPEGASHDRTEMLPLKAGVTLMALGALEKHPNLNLSIVPVGLNYFSAHKFRSRAYVNYGTRISVPPELVAMYSQGGTAKREACSKLLEMIQTGINNVTISAPDPDSLRLFKMSANLYVSSSPSLPSSPTSKTAQRIKGMSYGQGGGKALDVQHQLELTRRFARLYLKNRDNTNVMDDIKKTATRIMQYDRLLAQHGLEDADVERSKAQSKIGGLATFVQFIYRLLSVIILGSLALPGLILALPVTSVAAWYSHKKGLEAMESCDANIYGADVPGADVLASWKVMVAFVVFPLCAVIYTAIVAIIINVVAAPGPLIGVLVPLAFIFLLPMIIYASLRFWETGDFLMKSLKPLFYSLMRFGRSDELLVIRARLKVELQNLLDKIGRETLGSFEDIRSKSIDLLNN